MSDVVEIEIVEDRTAESHCDKGFLTVRRLRLRNVYADGGSSEPYDCDVVSRRSCDAVVAALYEIDGARQVRVLLRRATRAPIYLRRHKRFVHPDPAVYLAIDELVAGVVETDDPPGPAGLARRAAIEAHEEVGLAVADDDFVPLGGETFASPGTGDEKLYYCAASTRLDDARPGQGDGSIMEHGAHIVTLPLADAIDACRTGAIPDMKTEIGLLRLADHLGYLPQLQCFVDELPAALQQRYRRLGVAGVDSALPRDSRS